MPKILNNEEECSFLLTQINIAQLPKNNIGHTMPKAWGGNDQAVGTRCPRVGEAMPKAWGTLINKLKEDKKEIPTFGTVSNQRWA